MARISLKDVAKRAGLSTASVSHALNGTGSLKAETRAFICELAKEMGYRRNPVLSAIASRRFRPSDEASLVDCALLQLRGPDDERLKTFDRTLNEEFGRQAEVFGIRLRELVTIGSKGELSRFLGKAFRSGVEMLLVVASRNTDWLVGDDVEHFVILCMEDQPDSVPFDCVALDWGYSVRLCYAKLREQGCKRIGGLLEFPGTLTTLDSIRRGAFFSAWHGDHPHEIAPFYKLSYETSVGGEVVQWARENRLDGAVVWPLRYALKMREGLRGEEAVRVALPDMRTESDAYDTWQGLVLERSVVTKEACRILYDNWVHNRRGLRQNPQRTLIRGRWFAEGEPRDRH